MLKTTNTQVTKIKDMKTRNYLLALLMILPGTALFAQKIELDTRASGIEWIGRKATSQHNGNIQFKSGSLVLDDDRIVSGGFVVDMTTITNADIDNESRNQRLVGHLKSDDFFGVETYPEAIFVVTRGTKFSNGKATLNGNITIKGKSEPVTFEVFRSGNDYTAKLDVDRSKFDVRYGSDSFFDNLGDNAIHDLFTLNIRVRVM